MTKQQKQARFLRWALLLLIFTLTFEGVARKAYHSVALPLFFVKDVITFGIALYMLFCEVPAHLRWLLRAYWATVFFFIPPIIVTFSNDPLLAAFGSKQYLLFPVVALAAAFAFSNSKLKELNQFFSVAALLIIPTVGVAILQTRLPPTHWLNLSVGGDTLEGFSSGGQLRVSSTFAFVAQFVMFLNAQIYLLALPLLVASRIQNRWIKLLFFSLVPLLVVAMFITGSRGAVLGNLSMIAISGVLLFVCGREAGRGIFLVVAVATVAYLGFLGLRQAFPDFFVAYETRSADTEEHTHNQEVAGRVSTMLFGWLQNPLLTPTVFGNGLGVMSNGAEKLSAYAGSWRSFGRWTETDMATTLFEGGFYLIVVWMGFRLYIIGTLLMRMVRMPASDLFLPAIFCQGYVIVIGTVATLGIQPPASIWFWLAVGTQAVLTAPETTAVTDLVPAIDRASAEIGRRKGRSAYAERLHGSSV